MPIPAERSAVAPDGSDVRVLLGLAGGGMAHFELAAGETSIAVTHRTVEEIWLILSGRGEMWRRQGDREEVVSLERGVCLTIPVGTHFQLRSLGREALAAVGVTMPPWPGEGEAVVVAGKWRPTVSANEQRDFWSQVAQSYDRVVDLQIGPGTRGRVRERLAQEGRLGNVAEFGCGTGYYTEILASHSAAVVATDLSPGMLDLARERIYAANVTFQTEDVERTSFAAGSFDGVFMSLVLHFTEPEKTLLEMRRILKPGGTLILSNLDPGALRGLDRLRCSVRIVYQGVTGYRRRPPRRLGANVLTEARLRELLAKAGFEILACETLRDPSRSSYIPLEYVKAAKRGA
jgi:mannose-6-phosphate isomerase-like protein (cupin superfamily)/ubiquinone/menaquinone biosynthesis C-methylase UbiE